MAVEHKGIVQKTEGFITLGAHIRMPQDVEYAEDKPESRVTDSDTETTPSPKKQGNKKT